MRRRLGRVPGRGKRVARPRALGLGLVGLVGLVCVTAMASGARPPTAKAFAAASPRAQVLALSAQPETGHRHSWLDAPPTPEAAEWIEDTLADLDLRERVGQLVMVWMSGGYAPASDEEQGRIEALVRESGIGGIVISLGTPLGYVDRLNRLQSQAEVPLLVAADFESGAGYRLAGVYSLPSMWPLMGATMLPPAMAFGAIDEESYAYEAGRVTGIEARALGVHLNFAPVLDVNSNPDNPIIHTRSYGEDPERVAALGAAYIRGARDAGLLTTAKHFPGHGDTGTDSHIELPVISGDRERLDRVELVPFRRAIAEGVDAVMTAHIVAPGILDDDRLPATLSSYFMTRLLRDELGFGGVLFTDALDMAAVVDGYGDREIPIRALEAGADVLLMPRDPEDAIEAVVSAVRSGRLTPERIETSVRRILRLKARAGLDRERLVERDLLPDVVGVEAHTAFADSAARRSLTLVRDARGTFPIPGSGVRSVLSVTFARSSDLAAGRTFDGRLSEVLRVRRVRIGFETPADVYDSLLALSDSVDLVAISTYIPPPSADGSGKVPPELARLVAGAEVRGTRTALLSFGSPYVLAAIPESPSYLLAWGGGRASQRAAADALLGRTGISGRLPVSLPPLHALGEGLDRAPRPLGRHAGLQGAEALREVAPVEVGMDAAALSELDALLEAAILDGAAPGMALAVGRHGRLVRLRGYGTLDWAEGSAAVTSSSIYDLASLTKVVGTTTAVMQLVDEGRLSLNSRIARYLPEWGNDWKREVTVRELLLHRGGLPPFRPFWREIEGREAYRRAIGELELDYPVGTKTVYSDIGLMTLAFVVETITARPLDAYLEEAVFAPLGMEDTGFAPAPALRARIAPTEIDTTFRHRHLVGEVHDENAYALGQVAGHAGLFSSVRDLARFADWILAAVREGRGRASETRFPLEVPSPRTVTTFTRRGSPESSRALGWDTPSGRSSAGRYFGAGAFGHTGFTGTSLWVDPELDLFVVLLTNRVNPTRANQKHIELRRAVHDAVALAIRDLTVERRP